MAWPWKFAGVRTCAWSNVVNFGSDWIIAEWFAWIPWNLSFLYISFHEKRLQTMLRHHNARVNSHQRWKQTRFRVCFHLWCELTSTMNVTEWQVSLNSWALSGSRYSAEVWWCVRQYEENRYNHGSQVVHCVKMTHSRKPLLKNRGRGLTQGPKYYF